MSNQYNAQRPLTAKQAQWVAENRSTKTIAAMAEKLNRTEAWLQKWCLDNGIRRYRMFTPSENKAFARDYKTMPMALLCEKYGLSPYQAHYRADNLGVAGSRDRSVDAWHGATGRKSTVAPKRKMLRPQINEKGRLVTSAVRGDKPVSKDKYQDTQRDMPKPKVPVRIDHKTIVYLPADMTPTERKKVIERYATRTGY